LITIHSAFLFVDKQLRLKTLCKTILNRATQPCLYLQATCFGLDIDCHQAKKYTVIKRQARNEIYKTSSRLLWNPTVLQYLCVIRQ